MSCQASSFSAAVDSSSLEKNLEFVTIDDRCSTEDVNGIRTASLEGEIEEDPFHGMKTPGSPSPNVSSLSSFNIPPAYLHRISEIGRAIADCIQRERIYSLVDSHNPTICTRCITQIVEQGLYYGYFAMDICPIESGSLVELDQLEKGEKRQIDQTAYEIHRTCEHGCNAFHGICTGLKSLECYTYTKEKKVERLELEDMHGDMNPRLSQCRSSTKVYRKKIPTENITFLSHLPPIENSDQSLLKKDVPKSQDPPEWRLIKLIKLFDHQRNKKIFLYAAIKENLESFGFILRKQCLTARTLPLLKKSVARIYNLPKDFITPFGIEISAKCKLDEPKTFFAHKVCYFISFLQGLDLYQVMEPIRADWALDKQIQHQILRLNFKKNCVRQIKELFRIFQSLNQRGMYYLDIKGENLFLSFEKKLTVIDIDEMHSVNDIGLYPTYTYCFPGMFVSTFFHWRRIVDLHAIAVEAVGILFWRLGADDFLKALWAMLFRISKSGKETLSRINKAIWIVRFFLDGIIGEAKIFSHEEYLQWCQKIETLHQIFEKGAPFDIAKNFPNLKSLKEYLNKILSGGNLSRLDKSNDRLKESILRLISNNINALKTIYRELYRDGEEIEKKMVADGLTEKEIIANYQDPSYLKNRDIISLERKKDIERYCQEQMQDLHVKVDKLIKEYSDVWDQ
jgi:hypothetical protein